MKHSSVIYQFSLPNKRPSVIASIKEILEYINAHLTTQNDHQFKIEIVLTELLTNALKHTGDTEILIDVSIDQGNLIIEKKDYGNPFNPCNFLTLLKNAGHKVQLSKDDLYSVYALIELENQVRFICEENNESSDHDDLMEHFGLLIITRSAEDFIYRYDPASGLNTFYVRMVVS